MACYISSFTVVCIYLADFAQELQLWLEELIVSRIGHTLQRTHTRTLCTQMAHTGQSIWVKKGLPWQQCWKVSATPHPLPVSWSTWLPPPPQGSTQTSPPPAHRIHPVNMLTYVVCVWCVRVRVQIHVYVCVGIKHTCNAWYVCPKLAAMPTM